MSQKDFISHLLTECDVMIRYASGQGKTIPSYMPNTVYQLQRKQEVIESEGSSIEGGIGFYEHELSELTKCHKELSVLVCPAKPLTLAIMDKESTSVGWIRFLGPVKLVRHMSVLAVFFLLSIIGLSISPEVNQKTINEGLFNSEGKTLLLNQLFLLCCAGLGATFACLHKSRNYIRQCNYDPKFDSTYWSMVIMGFMAGLIIAELIPTADLAHGNPTISDFHKPLAALLGGFAADVIYSVLNRLVDVFNQLLGSTDQKTKDKVKNTITQADLAEQLHQHNKDLKESIVTTQDTNRQLLSLIADELTISVERKQLLLQQLGSTNNTIHSDTSKEKTTV
ncbi:hypothetical protein [Pseudoalteromonas luteoviolacea]|uniref:Uncharacterized protein n=1 Tax=Pseudoalteromonas luteoviolacea DSM 6061 TaxID=1365250 RepID=A0A166VAI5_9GAMM|nr:hypothetical protein [Pseudoalteromonas luteoviolacea]KZN32423.1 hypothetical protein N475_22340 [Pseudoalteromonas luteoviolacea DSM 6061]KZN56679.1 hypothetical protein N474_11035 [Pseudoalteromonas luteoviolacea CPMOR-2]MBE0386064.1 hypothetical protein [Pseudoalteromonas luteoviolacea DSM 6061]TQF70978.1 hypothetical protein FLM44_07790 [Pseudoalteromonas luteoviolacea]